MLCDIEIQKKSNKHFKNIVFYIFSVHSFPVLTLSVVSPFLYGFSPPVLLVWPNN